jgi:hypothetical protein
VPGQRIDVHTHAMPDEVIAAIASRGYKPTGGYRISVRWTPEAALAYMDRQEIAAQLVSMPMAFAGSDDDPEFGTRLSRMINEGHAELIAKHPNRFGAFATLPADGPDAALAELAYALDELRLDGVVLTSNVLGRYFGDPSLEPVLVELARREVPVFVHPVDCPHIDVLGFGRPTQHRQPHRLRRLHQGRTARRRTRQRAQAVPPARLTAGRGHRGAATASRRVLVRVNPGAARIERQEFSWRAGGSAPRWSSMPLRRRQPAERRTGHHTVHASHTHLRQHSAQVHKPVSTSDSKFPIFTSIS